MREEQKRVLVGVTLLTDMSSQLLAAGVRMAASFSANPMQPLPSLAVLGDRRRRRLTRSLGPRNEDSSLPLAIHEIGFHGCMGEFVGLDLDIMS